MQLGVVKDVSDTGGRVILGVLIDQAVHPEIQLLGIQGLRNHVVPGTRVLVLALAGDDTQLFALPVELATVASTAGTPRIEGRQLQGNAAALATKADAEALDARIDALEEFVNGQLYGGQGATAPAPQANTSATITGTQVFHAE